MIYIIITTLIDITSSVLISTTYQNINIMFPLIIVGSFPIFYNIIKKKKFFFITITILGIIYDTLFSDVFLINTYYFILYSLFIHAFYQKHNQSIINIVLISVIGTTIYDIFIFFTLILIHYSYFKITDLYYKIENTILFNLIYLVLSIIVLNSRIFAIKKRKKR